MVWGTYIGMCLENKMPFAKSSFVVKGEINDSSLPESYTHPSRDISYIYSGETETSTGVK